ncbi:hypothetical protein GCM10022215_17790 [Nocardioides fonticola]|uniref:DUF4333 domain-containing protein n=1 Tax=Nocardioides fonticola TaxID=450363 RepID=A0ABP7XHJ4_9ACTN
MTSTPPPSPPAGWYPSPEWPNLDQWWTGTAWSHRTRAPEASPRIPATPPGAHPPPAPETRRAPAVVSRGPSTGEPSPAWGWWAVAPPIPITWGAYLLGAYGSGAAAVVTLVVMVVVVVASVKDANRLRAAGLTSEGFVFWVLFGWVYFVARVVKVPTLQSGLLVAGAVTSAVVTGLGTAAIVSNGSATFNAGGNDEREIERQLVAQVGTEVSLDVDCPTERVSDGDILTCEGRASDGSFFSVTVTISAADGSYTWVAS